MTIQGLNCPNCGAPLSIPDGKSKCFCSNCGTPVLIDDGQIYININKTEKKEIVERKEIIDQAKIEKARGRSDSISFIALSIMMIAFFLFIFLTTSDEGEEILHAILEALHKA